MDYPSIEPGDAAGDPSSGSRTMTAALQRIAGIADVPLPIEVELDRKVLSVRGILALNTGSVLKLSRSAGENIDIRIGGSLVGFGEIVILEDSTGVRITDFWGES